MGYNCYQVKTAKLVAKQKGVFRTNCLDCLDRTNYIQSRIGLKAVKHFIERFSHEEIHSLSKEKRLLDMPVNDLYPLLRGFNELWADNGDAISLLYTGIGSTHTEYIFLYEALLEQERGHCSVPSTINSDLSCVSTRNSTTM